MGELRLSPKSHDQRELELGYSPDWLNARTSPHTGTTVHCFILFTSCVYVCEHVWVCMSVAYVCMVMGTCAGGWVSCFLALWLMPLKQGF